MAMIKLETGFEYEENPVAGHKHTNEENPM